MADRYDNDRPDPESDEDGQSVFDLFEPPPPTDPSSFGKIPVIKDAEIDLTDASDAERKAAADVEAAGLQHWTAPPTGQVPAVLSEKEPKSGLWGDVAGPSWHGDDPTWSGPDLADVFADADAIRLDEYDDEYDDEDEDTDEGLPRPPKAEPAGPRTTERPRPPVGEPPLAAAPERRERASRTPAANGDHQWPDGITDAAATTGHPPSRSSPRPRPDPAPSPEPHPGADGDRATWPTSPDLQPRRRQIAPSPERQQPIPQTTQTGASDHPDPLDRSPGRGPSPLAAGPEHRPGGHQRDDSGPIDRASAAPPPRTSLFDDDRSVPSIDDIEFADEASAAGAARMTGPTPSARPDHRPLDERYEEYDDYEDYEEYDDYDGFDDGGGRSRTGRNLPVAIAVGAALIGVLAGAIYLGPEMTLLLVVVVALVGVVELYNAMRLAGLRPANLLGIVGTAAAPAAAFYRGDAGLPLIVGLTVVFGSLWYLVGADSERPVLNLSLTMMGIFWVGGLASFAGLMLREDGGTDLLLAAIIITVVSDTMAYIGGRAYGRRPFHPASPNKTWEGTTTGFLGAVFAGFVIGVLEIGTLWEGNFFAAVALGAVVGMLAPIGDLTESVVKRDLGIKDMGQLLPGHGGVLDRVDALLFALPGAYYLALVAGLL